MKKNDRNIKNGTTLVTACCILLNLCEIHGDACDKERMVHDTRIHRCKYDLIVAESGKHTNS